MSSLVKRIATLCALLTVLAWSGSAGSVSPRALVEVVDFGAPIVSPNGEMVAFRTEQASLERNIHHTVWYVQSLDGESPPRQVAEGGVALRDSAGVSLPTRALWSPDSRWIYYIAQIDGKIDVWRAASDGSHAEAVTRDAANIQEFVLSQDGQIVTYRVKATREAVERAEEDEYDRGIHIDETVPVGQNLFRSGFVDGKLATQRLGFWFDRVPLLAHAPDRWKSVNVRTWERKDEVEPAAQSARSPALDEIEQLANIWKSVADARTGRVALLKRVGDSGELIAAPSVELWVQEGSRNRESTRCAAEKCVDRNITSMQWRPGSDELLFTVTDPEEGWAQSIYRWNTSTGRVLQVVRTGGQINGGRGEESICGASSAEIICVVAEADQPPRLERVHIDSGERRVVFDPNAALRADLASVAPAQLVRWEDASGQSFTGQFFPARTVDDAVSPLFVTYYKCPGFLRGGYGDEWPLVTLAARGISALCINAAPYQKDAVQRYDSGLSAVVSAVNLLAGQGKIDPSKVGMGGLSFGTEVTFWAIINSNLVTAASVSSLGISRQYELLGSMKGESFYRGLHEYWQLGQSRTEDRWRLISPANNLDKITAPILMQLPEQEYMHTLDYAVPLVREQKADLYVFPHEPHQKFQPRHKLAVYERNVDWFRFWLQGFEDSDVRKAEQYSHWRTTRSHRCDQMAAMDGVPWYCQSRE